MRTTRLFHPGPLVPGHEVSVTGDDARYLGRVLRLGPGAVVVLFDGRGGEYDAEILGRSRDTLTLRIGAHEPVDRESALAITLGQGISRGERMDLVVQKAAELGAARIVPLLCERGVVRLDERRARSRRDHWQRIAVSACQQCGRNRLPVIEPVTRLADWLPDAGGGLVLAPGSAESLRSAKPSAGRLTLLIGPEGGLTDDEVARAGDAGFLPVSLGPRVLRTETAAVAALAAAQLLWGDLG